jgi:hypothetical protein
MALFKMRVTVKTEYVSSIVVEADNLEQARKYMEICRDWEEDGSLDDPDDCWCHTYTPGRGSKINHIEELPKNYPKNAVPWNGDGHTTLETHLLYRLHQSREESEGLSQQEMESP